MYILAEPDLESWVHVILRKLPRRWQWVPIHRTTFPDGEHKLFWDTSLHGHQVIWLHRGTQEAMAQSMWQAFLTLDAILAQAPRHICVVWPYRPGGRANTSPQLQHLVSPLPIDCWVWVDGHHPHMSSMWPHPCIDVSPHTLWVDVLKTWNIHGCRPCVVAPDRGAQDRAARVAKAMEWPIFTLQKIRTPHGVAYEETADDFRERDCVLIDDVLDSGDTLYQSALLLRKKGARSVHACVTHVLKGFSRPFETLQSLTVSDSLVAPQSPPPFVRTVSLASPIAKVLECWSLSLERRAL